MTALAEHQPEDKLVWLELIRPTNESEFESWTMALGDAWSPKVERIALELMTRSYPRALAATQQLTARVVERALASSDHESWARRVQDNPRLLSGCWNTRVRTSSGSSRR